MLCHIQYLYVSKLGKSLKHDSLLNTIVLFGILYVLIAHGPHIYPPFEAQRPDPARFTRTEGAGAGVVRGLPERLR